MCYIQLTSLWQLQIQICHRSVVYKSATNLLQICNRLVFLYGYPFLKLHAYKLHPCINFTYIVICSYAYGRYSYGTQLHLYNLESQKLPVRHFTPASSEWLQFSAPHPLCEHSSMVDSVPAQFKSLSQILPLPCP